MGDGFSWRVEEEGGVTRFALSGSITEKSDFAPLLERSSGRVEIDLSGIDRINSAGVLGWLAFMTSLASRKGEVVLERCSVPIVHQLNMISKMRGGARVRSILLPYLCASCGAEEQSVLDLEGEAPSGVAQEMACPECGGTMEFDDLPETYFGFQEKNT